MIPGEPHFAGVLGWPLERTLSPAIHAAAFESVGLPWVYLAWAVPPESLASAVEGLRVLRASGANVTMPHKEAILPLLDDLDEDARAVGAVNTVASGGGRLIGHNTDVSGFKEFLAGDAGATISGARCVVLGAGGAARAVVKALSELDAEVISVVARDAHKAASVAAIAGARGRAEPWTANIWAVADADVVVNATPLGMNKEKLLEGARFDAGQWVVDLIYDPPSTPLIDSARSQGAHAWGGIGMLVHQAAGSFRIWTGQEPPLPAMSAAAVTAIAGRSRD
ncbi:MAG: shikimate dehydrogenase [Actinobacteria bacterium]|nr:shikimate dehydrogenase [Actinomycetota bacterium]